jgi:hypothetical protein
MESAGEESEVVGEDRLVRGFESWAHFGGVESGEALVLICKNVEDCSGESTACILPTRSLSEKTERPDMNNAAERGMSVQKVVWCYCISLASRETE